MDLTEAEDIKKRWQEYTEELYKNDLPLSPQRSCYEILIHREKSKKIFLSDQCKEIEENKQKGKTRDLFKKIRDTKGTFHAKMGSIKDKKRYGPNRRRRY